MSSIQDMKGKFAVNTTLAPNAVDGVIKVLVPTKSLISYAFIDSDLEPATAQDFIDLEYYKGNNWETVKDFINKAQWEGMEYAEIDPDHSEATIGLYRLNDMCLFLKLTENIRDCSLSLSYPDLHNIEKTNRSMETVLSDMFPNSQESTKEFLINHYKNKEHIYNEYMYELTKQFEFGEKPTFDDELTLVKH